MKKIAITGNFGVGKSTVGEILISLGYDVIDTDQIVHELLSVENEQTKKIVSIFGDIVKSGLEDYFINKKELAKIVFSDIDKKKKLEEIVHPFVRLVVDQFFKSNSLKKCAFVLIPLVFESSQESFYDEIWCVVCNVEAQTSRLLLKGFSIDQINARLKVQLNQAIKAKKSDFVIDNSGSKVETKKIILDKLVESRLN